MASAIIAVGIAAGGTVLVSWALIKRPWRRKVGSRNAGSDNGGSSGDSGGDLNWLGADSCTSSDTVSSCDSSGGDSGGGGGDGGGD